MSESALDETKVYQDSLVHDYIKVDPYLAIRFLTARLELKQHLLDCAQNLNIDTLEALQHMSNIIKDLEQLCLSRNTIHSEIIMEILNKKLS